MGGGSLEHTTGWALDALIGVVYLSYMIPRLNLGQRRETTDAKHAESTLMFLHC